MAKALPGENNLISFIKKKAEITKGSSFGNSAVFLKRPAAFRPLLAKGLALSGFYLDQFFGSRLINLLLYGL